MQLCKHHDVTGFALSAKEAAEGRYSLDLIQVKGGQIRATDAKVAIRVPVEGVKWEGMLTADALKAGIGQNLNVNGSVKVGGKKVESPAPTKGFPDIDRIVPEGVPTAILTLGVPQFLKLLQYAADNAAETITFAVHDTIEGAWDNRVVATPLHFAMQVGNGAEPVLVDGVIMPCAPDEPDELPKLLGFDPAEDKPLAPQTAVVTETEPATPVESPNLVETRAKLAALSALVAELSALVGAAPAVAEPTKNPASQPTAKPLEQPTPSASRLRRQTDLTAEELLDKCEQFLDQGKAGIARWKHNQSQEKIAAMNGNAGKELVSRFESLRKRLDG